MKLAITSDLILLRALLIFSICLLEIIININLLVMMEFIGMITCFLDRPFVIMLSLGFFFLELFMTL